MRDDLDELLTQPAKFIAEPAAQLLGGRAQGEVSLRSNQIDDGFRLGQVDFAVEIGALGKFAGSGRACPCSEACFQDFGRNQCAAMTTDFDQIFAGIAAGRAMHR